MQITQFLNAVFWEYVQNLPVILLFVAAVWLWTEERKREALICIIVNAISGSLIIRFTEPLISGYEEPISTTLVNIVSFGTLQIIFAAYLASDTKWSNWKVDIALGGLAGASLAIAQGIASQGSPLIGIILHSIALGIIGALIVIAIRKLKQQSLTEALKNALLITTFMTLIISAIDYSYLLILEGF